MPVARRDQTAQRRAVMGGMGWGVGGKGCLAGGGVVLCVIPDTPEYPHADTNKIHKHTRTHGGDMHGQVARGGVGVGVGVGWWLWRPDNNIFFLFFFW